MAFEMSCMAWPLGNTESTRKGQPPQAPKKRKERPETTWGEDSAVESGREKAGGKRKEAVQRVSNASDIPGTCTETLEHVVA